MSNDVMEGYLKLIKNKIKFIYGYSSAIYLLAKYALEEKYTLIF